MLRTAGCWHPFGKEGRGRQLRIRETRQESVTGRETQLALREVRAHFSQPRTWLLLLIAGILLGWSGPFGTFDALALVPRLLYWLIVVTTTYATGVFVHGRAARSPALRHAGFWRATLTGGLLTGAAVTLVLLGINWAGLGLAPAGAGYLLTMAANATGASLLISIALALAGRAPRPPPPTARGEKPPRLLARLPLDKRGMLISLSGRDHYVEVRTDKGHAMLLMRFTDAMAETEGVDGLQVHRSHWVALNQVRTARRAGDRAVLGMSDGRDIPVSRTYVKAIRAAGLLP